MTALQQPVVVVGAGRSGTTMTREALSAHPDLHALTYEMNYLWRSGWANLPHDLLTPEDHYREREVAKIRTKLAELLAESGKPRLVEKTVANVVRLRFVHAVLPDAKIIHIIRDGRAVTASAIKRWSAKPESGYLMDKARTIPLASLPTVAVRYLKNRVSGALRKRDYQQSWGPRWPGIDEDVKRLSLTAVCAKQWAVSVRAALAQKDAIPAEQYLQVRYEDVVQKPLELFDAMARFINVDPDHPDFKNHLNSEIHAGSIDGWRRKLDAEQQADIQREAGDLLEELGYT